MLFAVARLGNFFSYDPSDYSGNTLLALVPSVVETLEDTASGTVGMAFDKVDMKTVVAASGMFVVG